VNPFRLIFLAPFSIIYGVLTWIRNKLFDWRIIPSQRFGFPVISVGNLSAGGTGKTPHVEYLIRLFTNDNHIATLSRGYKRTTKGFILAGDQPSAEEIGDEPCQFKIKFPLIAVAVDEKRRRGIRELRRRLPETNIILLDDAFQHRYVKPGLSILLTDYHNLYSGDWLLPAGTLREFRSGARRADIIIVTKNSKIPSPITRREIIGKLKPAPAQKVYFSYVEHGPLTKMKGFDCANLNKKRYNTILMVAGIANTYPLELHLKSFCDELERIIFPDHHRYDTEDIKQIIEKFDNIVTRNKIIVTTEKDSVRLSKPEFIKLLKGYPLAFIPIEVAFYKEDESAFEKQILDYVRTHSGNNQLHQEQDQF
jgi:tetraacyldisaccharide 4'-kinase